MITLKPLKNKVKRREKSFATFDIEGRDWINHVVSAFYTKDEDDNETLKYFTSMKEACEFFTSSENPVSEIYCHFGGIYDFLFIIKECLDSTKYGISNLVPRGNSLLMFDVTSGDRKVTFKDSSAILPFGLDSLTENFGVKHKKLEMDRTNITEDTKEVREYLKNDVVGLYECIYSMKTWGPIKECGFKSTIAAQSVQIMRSHLKIEVPALTQKQDMFVRKGYFGGRTEIFKPLCDIGSPLYYYDINSLYPTVMREISVPIHPMPSKTIGDPLTDCGFFECTVFVPPMYYPPLPVVQRVKKQEKLIFPTGTFRGTWYSDELQYASQFGVKILKVHKVLLFSDRHPLFKDFVDEMYNIRINSNKNSVDNILAKLVMNSCYGRFGLNRLRERMEFDYGQDNFDPCYEIPYGDSLCRIGKVKEYSNQTHSHVAVSAAITSNARIKNHQMLIKDPTVFYTDTDSKFTLQKEKTSDELGGLKLEYELKKACFLLPKTYIMMSEDDVFKYIDEKGKKHRSYKKLAMKGFQKNLIQKFEFDDFLMALDGDLRRLKVVTPAKMARMKQAFQRGEVLTMLEESTKQIKSTYDKRRIIKGGKYGYDTEPLHIEKGEVINL